MSENNLEGEQRERCKEAQFVDKNEAALIERVTAVMPIADELKSKDMLHGEKYDEIKAEVTNQRKMRMLFESLKADMVKIAFYKLLEKHELPLFKELGGVCRKRKLADPESPVPCKIKNPPAPEKEKKPPAPKVKKPPTPKKKKPPARKIKKPPVPKVKKPPAPKKKKPPARKIKKPPAPKKVKKQVGQKWFLKHIF